MNLSKNSIWFSVAGEPVAKARARVFRNKYSGKIHAFTPKKTVDAENALRLQSLAFKPKEPIQTPVWLHIKVFRGIPASFSAIKKGVACSGELLPTTKPDIDNYVKLILDAMSDWWNDDSQVVSIQASKYYSSNPRLEIEVQY